MFNNVIHAVEAVAETRGLGVVDEALELFGNMPKIAAALRTLQDFLDGQLVAPRSTTVYGLLVQGRQSGQNRLATGVVEQGASVVGNQDTRCVGGTARFNGFSGCDLDTLITERPDQVGSHKGLADTRIGAGDKQALGAIMIPHRPIVA